ncbi:hypothetical protein ACRYCC_41875 [Actinomadura scrupuli]|uniref:hypothetical protein n=1 Tax=Actinomadura scrupuli TaxID=559629 RepID=UPI003D989C78
MSTPLPGRATVLAATVASGKWYQSGKFRYDFVLDVRPGDGGAPFRVQLLNVRIYQAAPQPGIEVAVEIVPGTQEVTLLWKDDPNLDLNAWRRQRELRDEQIRLAALNGTDPADPRGPRPGPPRV